MLRDKLRFGLLAISCGLAQCGDNVSIKDASGNAMLILDTKPGTPVDGLNMVLNEVRVWKSTPNDQGPGIYDSIDNYAVEIWATLDGETLPRYFRESSLVADSAGNLYLPGLSPGQIQYPTRSEPTLSDTPENYTISTSDPFISLETAAPALLTKIAVSDTSTITTRVAIDPAAIDKTPWADLKYREYVVSLFDRVRREKNTDNATKGKMGCLLVDKTSGAENFGAFQFADIELGNTVRFGSQMDNKNTSSKGVQTADKSGADNYLVMQWQEVWYLTGLNIITRHLRMVQERWVPFYQVRELAGVDRSTADPQPSGLENLVRSCNAAAAGGAFRMVYLAPSALKKSATLAISGDNSHCAALKTASTGAAALVRSIPLNTANYAGTYSPAGTDSADLGCNFTEVKTGLGSWTGGPTAGQFHDGNVVPSGSDIYYYFDQSKIVETTL